MRQVAEEMAARIESGAAMLCHVWLLAPRDGERLGFTDHDRDLVLDGVACRAASGWTGGVMETAEGLAPGALAAAGGLDAEALDPDALEAGAYDGARLELWRVDWVRPDLRVRLWRGTLSRVRRIDERFEAEIEGPMAALERVVGRTYGRDCDAVLGDARCGVNRAAFPDQACDRRWSTCTGTFGNGVNFRGYPSLPGDDFLTARPAAGGRHDGGRR